MALRCVLDGESTFGMLLSEVSTGRTGRSGQPWRYGRRSSMSMTLFLEPENAMISVLSCVRRIGEQYHRRSHRHRLWHCPHLAPSYSA